MLLRGRHHCLPHGLYILSLMVTLIERITNTKWRTACEVLILISQYFFFVLCILPQDWTFSILEGFSSVNVPKLISCIIQGVIFLGKKSLRKRRIQMIQICFKVPAIRWHFSSWWKQKVDRLPWFILYIYLVIFKSKWKNTIKVVNDVSAIDSILACFKLNLLA